MVHYAISVEDGVSEKDRRVIEQGLTAHALPVTRVPGFQPVAVLARDGDGVLVAGAVGTINWNWLHVSLVWVSEPLRRTGLGSRLMAEIERVGASRGCTHAHLDTFSYQARPFYERQGYRLFGVLDDYPPGQRRFFLEKALVGSTDPAPAFQAPTATERIFNRAFGVLVRLGLGLGHNYLLEVRGRRTGRAFATPVNVLELDGRRWLVAGRGRTQWVRNAEVAGEAILRRGWRTQRVRLRPVADADKPAILSAYVDRFRLTVQRYFPVRAGSAPAAFVPVAGRYPVFELLPPGR